MRRLGRGAVAARVIATFECVRTRRACRLDPRCFGGEAFGKLHHLGLDARQLLDVAQVRPLIIRHEADRGARCAGPRGAADAVDILLGHVGQLEVEHVGHARHVDAARGDVGRDEHLGLARLELGERAFALRLALIAVDRVGDDAIGTEQLHDAVGTVLGAGEDERALDLLVTQQDRQQRLLFALVEEGDELVDALGGAGGRRDLHRLGIVEELVGKLTDRIRHRRREEQGLALLGQHPHDLAQRVDEAEVEHLVSFVEHQDFKHREADETLLDQVEQAARRRDEDVDAARHVLAVLVDAGAAEHGCDRHLGELTVFAGTLGDLAGQFARRGEHEHAAMRRQHALFVVDELLDRREHEGRRLAGAGLRDAEQIAAFEQDRDRLLLDRGGGGVALGFERADERLGEAELCESHNGSVHCMCHGRAFWTHGWRGEDDTPREKGSPLDNDRGGAWATG